ncbi:anion permease [Streptomyces sp. NPDC020800]|uniref:anion permease n=1 Tax=Streptomyces sp. NPDC020800 TaxID=3365092 RepID=UPI00379A55B4
MITGVNDGGTLLAMGMKLPAVRALPAVVILAVSAGVVPMLVGTSVAGTFAHRLVSFHSGQGRLAVAVAVITAVVVVWILTARGLPTSLTLAIIGAVSGAGLGFGFPIAWGLAGTVVLVGLAAPVIGGLAAHGLLRLAAFARQPQAGRTLATTHRVAFVLQCLAYSANDGQKMLAVFVVASGFVGTSQPQVGLSTTLVLIVAFGVGVAVGLLRIGRLADRVLPADPFHAVTAEVAASAVVFVTALIGVPVSTTQAVAGGLVGAGMTHSYRRIRWRGVMTITSAWLCTLPVVVALSAGCAVLIRIMLG